MHQLTFRHCLRKIETSAYSGTAADRLPTAQPIKNLPTNYTQVTPSRHIMHRELTIHAAFCAPVVRAVPRRHIMDPTKRVHRRDIVSQRYPFLDVRNHNREASQKRRTLDSAPAHPPRPKVLSNTVKLASIFKNGPTRHSSL